MTVQSYKPSLALVLAHEGGFVNHPSDPGGPTNQGVTQRVYDAYRRLHGLSVQSVRLINAGEVADIYKKQYWQLVRGDDLPAGLDYAVFDFAVNSGISRALKYLQRLVCVNPDGVIGNETLDACHAMARVDENFMIVQYCGNRMTFLKSLATFPTFGRGWTRRVVGQIDGVQASDSGVIDYAVKMAAGDTQYEMPSAIGKLSGEVPAKAVAASADVDNYPFISSAELKELMKANDSIAYRILLDRLN